MVQLVMGVAWWILPRTAEGVAGAVRGERVVWAVLVLINTGVIVAALGTMPDFSPALTTAGRGAEALAAGLFALSAWNRQRPYRATTRRRLV